MGAMCISFRLSQNCIPGIWLHAQFRTELCDFTIKKQIIIQTVQRDALHTYADKEQSIHVFRYVLYSN